MFFFGFTFFPTGYLSARLHFFQEDTSPMPAQQPPPPFFHIRSFVRYIPPARSMVQAGERKKLVQSSNHFWRGSFFFLFCYFSLSFSFFLSFRLSALNMCEPTGPVCASCKDIWVSPSLPLFNILWYSLPLSLSLTYTLQIRL